MEKKRRKSRRTQDTNPDIINYDREQVTTLPKVTISMTISQKVDHTRLGAKGYSEKTEFECREKV
jgi:hypothetical protein